MKKILFDANMFLSKTVQKISISSNLNNYSTYKQNSQTNNISY